MEELQPPIGAFQMKALVFSNCIMVGPQDQHLYIYIIYNYMYTIYIYIHTGLTSIPAFAVSEKAVHHQTEICGSSVFQRSAFEFEGLPDWGVMVRWISRGFLVGALE